MKRHFLTLVFLLLSHTVFCQHSGNFINTDITNFWNAYDKIRSTQDSVLQYNYITSLYLEKGTPGLKAIMLARSYTAKSFVDAINSYPKFWESIRKNTLRSEEFVKAISDDVGKIKLLYPALKPANIYFTMGALRTGGTTLDGMVLIGSEIALTDKNAVTTEFPISMAHLRPYFDTNPIENIVFSNVHEYVHTQQKTTVCSTLLGQSVMEGVAEFVAVTATGKASTAPAISYGKEHFEQVRSTFTRQMFNPTNGFWLYSNASNEFNNRDMGYYIGYEICERYYSKSEDKKLAIKEMIELDYNNLKSLKNFVEMSGYLDQPIALIEKDFEASRPQVVALSPFKNNAQNVDPAIETLIFHFSEKLDPRFRNFELGPLGEKNLLRLEKFNSFSPDGKSVSFDVKLKPNQKYQIVLGPGFRTENGIPLKPFLVDFKTSAQ